MSSQTFPGVYTNVTDNSFFTPITSRFRCGLLGPATNGPINTAVRVQSLRDFNAKFGVTIPGTYLAPAVQLTSNLSDGVFVVRVAREYSTGIGSGAVATGTANATTITTANAPLFKAGDYVRVRQPGLASTVNLEVVSSIGTTLTLNGKLKATYTGATIDRSRVTADMGGDSSDAANAANEAEAFLYGPVWNATCLGGGVPATPVSATVKVSGTKGQYSVNVVSDSGSAAAGLAAGTLVIIEQDGLTTSRELQVQSYTPAVPGVPATITFYSSGNGATGFQAVPLQDNYTVATIRIVSQLAGAAPTMQLFAVNPGTWANSDGVSTGLIVKVSAGSQPDTKKIQCFLNSALVETIDNLSGSPTIVDSLGVVVPNPQFFATAINGKSSYITAVALADNDGNLVPPTNTYDGWSPTSTSVNFAYFSQGWNGENVLSIDYIGQNLADDSATGLKIFEDSNYNVALNYMACPGVTDPVVAQEMARIGHIINAQWLLDVPAGLTLAQATDWTNGVGVGAAGYALNDFTGSYEWQWFTITDASTGKALLVPPSCGALRCLAYTFDSFKPWYAAAGENRGAIPEALSVSYPKVSEDAKQSSSSAGNCVNGIFLNRGNAQRWGNRTTQRADSKLTAQNNVTLVFTVVKALAAIGRKYTFDPNDKILLSQIYHDFTHYLDGVVKERGIEEYLLTIDGSNNTPDTRNQREVIADLALVPVDAAERLFVNASVRASGAVLNSVN